MLYLYPVLSGYFLFFVPTLSKLRALPLYFGLRFTEFFTRLYRSEVISMYFFCL
jgi:hypothetical protein